jgi:23S rRNA pseudouridine2605 synthase
LCNRREADQLIVKGDILVNGSVVNKLGSLVKPESIVSYKGKTLARERLQYVLFNKPSENKPLNDYNTIVLSSCKEAIIPIEISNNSISGLFLFTNDEALIKKLSLPGLSIHNQYAVELKDDIDNEELKELNKIFKKVIFNPRKKMSNQLLITTNFINAGDEILSALENKKLLVYSIDRVEYAHLKKGPLTRGKCRFLSNREIGFLKMLKAPR